ncbi:hypothetical protein F7725_023258 [Dissostichus mawsoni]|uniref:ethanolamine kinase n=1 Tax=Dissostichus mawsoni TaxID=36200 RepID=A0A7J5Z158_DISMA|nr:hypothetical protein F7725_023258 [Dissostichus mawsoni]
MPLNHRRPSFMNPSSDILAFSISEEIEVHFFLTSYSPVPSFETLSAEMESLKRHLSQIDSPTVLCHNDLLTKNIIYNHKEGMVKFIDYEYADYNYQAFDIGNHFNEFAGVNDVNYSRYPSRELQRDWLTAYLQSYNHSTGREVTVTEAESVCPAEDFCPHCDPPAGGKKKCAFEDLIESSKECMRTACPSHASNFLWGLWAILQSRFSSIEFDFERYATARLNYYFEKKEEYFGLQII